MVLTTMLSMMRYVGEIRIADSKDETKSGDRVLVDGFQVGELVDALQVNPYDTESLAELIHRALEMPPEERRARMSRMRTYVREHNIYRWAGSLIAELASIRVDSPAPESEVTDAAFVRELV